MFEIWGLSFGIFADRGQRSVVPGARVKSSLQFKIVLLASTLVVIIAIGQSAITYYHERVNIHRARMQALDDTVVRIVSLAESPLYNFEFRELRRIMAYFLRPAR